MLQIHQLKPIQIFQIHQFTQEKKASIGANNLNRPMARRTFPFPILSPQESRTIPILPIRRIRRNIQMPNKDYHTYIHRISKRMRSHYTRLFPIDFLNNKIIL